MEIQTIEDILVRRSQRPRTFSKTPILKFPVLGDILQNDQSYDILEYAFVQHSDNSAFTEKEKRKRQLIENREQKKYIFHRVRILQEFWQEGLNLHSNFYSKLSGTWRF
jgi:hypothetical protein